jgi:hypothetical protein
MPPRTPPTTGRNSHDHLSPLHRRRLLGVAALGGLVGLAGCTSLTRREASETRSFDPATVDRLVVADVDGDVVVRGEETDTVRLSVRKTVQGQVSLDDVEVESRVADGRLTVRSRRPAVVGVGGSSVAVELAVPPTTRVERVAADDGRVEVTNVRGGTDLAADDGRIEVRDLRGDLSVSTDDGDVRLRDVDGVVSVSGDDGAVDVAGATLGSVRLDDGDATLAVERLRDGASVRTDDGSVTLTFASGLDATVEVLVDDGEVSSEGVFDRVEQSSKTYLRGVLGAGGPTLTVRTDDGSVTLRRQ